MRVVKEKTSAVKDTIRQPDDCQLHVQRQLGLVRRRDGKQLEQFDVDKLHSVGPFNVGTLFRFAVMVLLPLVLSVLGILLQKLLQ